MRLAEITGKSEPEGFAGIFGTRQAYGEPGLPARASAPENTA